jgi:hypothetical protein
MVCFNESPVDGARVPSTERQAPQPWVVIRPSVIQSRTGMRTSIPLRYFRVATLEFPRDQQASMVHHALKGPALNFYRENIHGQVAQIGEIF